MNVAATSSAASERGSFTQAFAGVLVLARFILRRDRVRIAVWLGALTLMTAATAGSFLELYGAEAARAAIAATMNTPAGLVMTGPRHYLTDYNLGSMMGHQLLGFMSVMVALMSVLMLVRHTRAEEESGRAELVRACVVGRHAHLSAALLVVTGTNVALALLLALALGGLGYEGITWSGSLLYGAAHGAVGIVFAGLAAVTVQLTAHSRGATGMALALLGLAYVLRAAGDAGGHQAVSWLSPIGWAQATYVYVDNRWWPLLLCLVVSAAVVALAFTLSLHRDLGAGLRQTSAGARSASSSLVHPLGFALRLHRGMWLAFGTGMALIGLAYGSILGDVEQMLGSNERMAELLAGMGGATMAESVSPMFMTVMSIITSVYAVLAVLRMKAEESAGRLEPLLATALSRTRWLMSHLAIALFGGALVLVLGALGIGGMGSAVLDDESYAPKMLVAALAYVPALWVTASVALALYGLCPRFTALSWVIPVYAFVVGYLGQLLQAPKWLSQLSPFGHVPQVPVAELTFAPLVVLTLLAAALIAAGVVGFSRRDLHGR